LCGEDGVGANLPTPFSFVIFLASADFFPRK
jgi:hypothetical protein